MCADKKGFCALEAILAGGILAGLSLLMMQTLTQQVFAQKDLLCRQEAQLILLRHKSIFEAVRQVPLGEAGQFSNGVSYELKVLSDTKNPFLQKACFEIAWASHQRHFSETLNGVICKWN